jgi:O-antigen ligase
MLAAATLIAFKVGQYVAAGQSTLLVVGSSVAVIGITLTPVILGHRYKSDLWAVELPITLLLASTFIFTVRTAEDLAASPLDSAALRTVAVVGLASLLGAIAFLSADHPVKTNGAITTLPVRLYALYVVIVFVAAPISVHPHLTAYRGVELLAAVVVILGATRWVGIEAPRRLMTAMYWLTAVLVVMVWIGALIAPEVAIKEIRLPQSPIRWQLQGYIPVMASNSVGKLGAILALWSLANVLSKGTYGPRSRSLGLFMTFIGLATLIASQYRTGYVAFAVGFLWLLALKKKALLGFGGVLLALLLMVSNPLLVERAVETAEPYVLRGQTLEQAQELSGRIDWWTLGLPVWRESPLIGKGLLTATRFEVLAPAGFGLTSAIHSTWVEALIGTGLIGAGLLAAALAIAWKRSFSVLRRSGAVVPTMILLVLTVRSLTGNTFESLSYDALLFLCVALSLRDNARMDQSHANSESKNGPDHEHGAPYLNSATPHVWPSPNQP